MHWIDRAHYTVYLRHVTPPESPTESGARLTSERSDSHGASVATVAGVKVGACAAVALALAAVRRRASRQETGHAEAAKQNLHLALDNEDAGYGHYSEL